MNNLQPINRPADLDGWENSPITLYTLRLYEVTEYVSWTRHFMTPDLFGISAKRPALSGTSTRRSIRMVSLTPFSWLLSNSIVN